jgi:hypothetical protein
MYKVLLLVLSVIAMVIAQDNTTSLAASGNDVYLNVRNLEVDQIYIGVKTINASIALNAQVASLVNLQIGVNVAIEQVKINITGVRAQLELSG